MEQCPHHLNASVWLISPPVAFYTALPFSFSHKTAGFPFPYRVFQTALSAPALPRSDIHPFSE